MSRLSTYLHSSPFYQALGFTIVVLVMALLIARELIIAYYGRRLKLVMPLLNVLLLPLLLVFCVMMVARYRQLYLTPAMHSSHGSVQYADALVAIAAPGLDGAALSTRAVRFERLALHSRSLATVRLINKGTTELLARFGIAAAYRKDFTLQNRCLTRTLLPGAGCDLTITFLRNTPGSIHTLLVVSSAVERGNSPRVTVEPATLSRHGTAFVHIATLPGTLVHVGVIYQGLPPTTFLDTTDAAGNLSVELQVPAGLHYRHARSTITITVRSGVRQGMQETIRTVEVLQGT